mmetsp:Transcript_1715/g.10573  ORF Transcript_1715/g.10573 Transcript_1715/m.10573 type:complete len:91 (-) Transcript_1715:1506-1778(-)
MYEQDLSWRSTAYCPHIFDSICRRKGHPKTCPMLRTQSDWRKLNKTTATACQIIKLFTAWHLQFIVNGAGNMYSTPPPLTKPGVQKDEHS